MQTGRRLPVTFVRGRGCVVYDDSGREYLDLVAGIAVNLLGHAHPEVVVVITKQSAELIHTSNLYFTQPQVELAKRLVELAFPARVFFSNSGAEANEAAIKLARKWGAGKGWPEGRIISFEITVLKRKASMSWPTPLIAVCTARRNS